MFTIKQLDIAAVLLTDIECSDVGKAIDLTNNLIMFNSQLEELESKYSLELKNKSYKEVLRTIENLDQKLFELIESRKGA